MLPFVPRKRHLSPVASEVPEKQPKRKSTKKKPNLFEIADQPRAIVSVNDNKAFLERLADSEQSALSEAGSDDFENALPQHSAKRRKVEKFDHDGQEENMDWEDAIAHPESSLHQHSLQEPSGDLEITLDSLGNETSFINPNTSKKGPSKIERQIRVTTHCLHVQYLLFHNYIRNRWICDEGVQKLLLHGLTYTCKKEVDRWRAACGDSQGEEWSDGKANSTKKKIPQGKPRKSDQDSKSHRDWGRTATHMEEGMPNLSHGDPLLRLLKVLCKYWRKKFIVTAPGLRKLGYKDVRRLEEEIKAYRNAEHNAEEHGERIRNIEEFRKCAIGCEGSRDVGAQLFTALLRSLGMEARLVANLQPVGFGWSKNEEAHHKKSKAKEDPNPASASMTNGQESAGEEDPRPVSRRPVKRKPNPSTARRSRTMPNETKSGGRIDAPIILLDDDESELSTVPPSSERSDDDSVVDVTNSRSSRPLKHYDRDLPFPIYWTEVLSPITHTWIPVDPLVLNLLASKAEHLMEFEPRGTKADKAKQVIAYVVAFSSDGTAKDVTVRYLKRHMWPGKTKGVRMPIEKVPIYSKRGKVRRYEEYDFSTAVMTCYKRDEKKRTVADEIEDSRELQPVRVVREAKDSGQETLQGYKNSAEFVLERHLRREEALITGAKKVKSFTTGKGDEAKSEPVYHRADVVVCRTIESWHKEGREVKEGQQPLKFVPMRAVTTIRKREIEEAERETGEKLKQALYSHAQTDWIIPPPIKNGVIPKNAFGNMDVYVPTMVPKGAVHIRLKGTAKLCKKLEIDYAEACTGFEFGNRRAVPVLTGVVVARENKDVVIQAWRAEQEEKAKKEDDKREKTALSMWKKMLTGLRIVERFTQEYKNDAEARIQDAIHPMASKRRRKKAATDVPGMAPGTKEHAESAIVSEVMLHGEDDEVIHGGGGFLVDDGCVTKTTEHDDGGGGFIVEDATDTIESYQHDSVASGYLNNPIALTSADQGKPYDASTNIEALGGANHGPSLNHRAVFSLYRKENGRHEIPVVVDKVTKRKQHLLSGAAVRSNRSTRKGPERTLEKQKRTLPSSLAASASEDDKDSDGRIEKLSISTKQAGQGATTLQQRVSNRSSVALRRQAPRKSKDAIRSGYFVHGSSDDE